MLLSHFPTKEKTKAKIWINLDTFLDVLQLNVLQLNETFGYKYNLDTFGCTST